MEQAKSQNIINNMFIINKNIVNWSQDKNGGFCRIGSRFSTKFTAKPSDGLLILRRFSF